ncbi:MAG: outer membrane protein assembly factor BamD [Verrucomicrobia bacterium]|nr:outer membrane protein assembly factor BamD [Verrucomicrobiota bacterium]
MFVALAVTQPCRCPAPLTYRAGEGWTYEPVGGADWTRDRADAQLEVAQQAFENEDFRLAAKAAKRIVERWPYSDFAPDAQFLLARCYENRDRDERAFKEYQKLIKNYPNNERFEQALKAQFEIANRFLNGQWFKVWGLVPLYPSMKKTADMYKQIIENGPYSEYAPLAQLKIGQAHENSSEYIKAAEAYNKAADIYHNMPDIAADANFKAGLAFKEQARAAEYDQSLAGKAIAAFTDFTTLFPSDPRVEEAEAYITELQTEQARGFFKIAKFYEKRQKLLGALIYYNEVVIKSPDSTYAQEAKINIQKLQERLQNQDR